MNYVNAAELAKTYRVQATTILAWARRGIIPTIRASRRHLLFDPAAVDAAIKAHQPDENQTHESKAECVAAA